MTQPLSGESSVLGTDFISDGFLLISTKGKLRVEQGKSCKKRAAQNRGHRPGLQGEGSITSKIMSMSRSTVRGAELNAGFAVGGAEADGFLRKIVAGPDETDGTAFGPHQNRMGDGGRALGTDAPQKRAIADTGGAKDDVFSVGQIIGGINAIDFFFVTLLDQFLAFFLVTRPHFALHIPPETLDPRRR